jgi:biopolymer transport protein ExbD
MASRKLQGVLEQADEDAKMDMSPMIDMVFLLLIFFMIASRMVTVRVDPEIKPPVADQSVKPKSVKGRIVFNIYAKGAGGESKYTTSDGSKTVTLEEITTRVEKFADSMEARGTEASLLLRAHKDAEVSDIKKVAKAAAEGGINKVIFGAFKTAK